MTAHQALIKALTVERQQPMPRWQLNSPTAMHYDSDALIAERRAVWGQPPALTLVPEIIPAPAPVPAPTVPDRRTKAEKDADRMEDITWLIEAGEAPEQIAIRIGVPIANLTRWLWRHDRPDLARMFERKAA